MENRADFLFYLSAASIFCRYCGGSDQSLGFLHSHPVPSVDHIGNYRGHNDGDGMVFPGEDAVGPDACRGKVTWRETNF